MNDRIRVLAARWGGPEAREYVCECGSRDCRGAVSLTLAEYDAVRAHPNRFIVGAGHPVEPPDRLVWLTDRFAILETSPVAVSREGSARAG